MQDAGAHLNNTTLGKKPLTCVGRNSIRRARLCDRISCTLQETYNHSESSHDVRTRKSSIMRSRLCTCPCMQCYQNSPLRLATDDFPPGQSIVSILSLVCLCHGLLRYPNFRQLSSREWSGRRFERMFYITRSNAYIKGEKFAMTFGELQRENIRKLLKLLFIFGGHAVLLFQQGQTPHQAVGMCGRSHSAQRGQRYKKGLLPFENLRFFSILLFFVFPRLLGFAFQNLCEILFNLI